MTGVPRIFVADLSFPDLDLESALVQHADSDLVGQHGKSRDEPIGAVAGADAPAAPFDTRGP